MALDSNTTARQKHISARQVIKYGMNVVLCIKVSPRTTLSPKMWHECNKNVATRKTSITTRSRKVYNIYQNPLKMWIYIYIQMLIKIYTYIHIYLQNKYIYIYIYIYIS